MPVDLQSFPEAIYKGLEQGFIVGNGLEYVSICCHIADSPLAQPRTTQSEDVTEKREIRHARVMSLLIILKKRAQTVTIVHKKETCSARVRK